MSTRDAVYFGWVLLYPTVGLDLEHEVVLGRHRMQMRTADLGKGWKEIEGSLLDFVAPASQGAATILAN